MPEATWTWARPGEGLEEGEEGSECLVGQAVFPTGSGLLQEGGAGPPRSLSERSAPRGLGLGSPSSCPP